MDFDKLSNSGIKFIGDSNKLNLQQKTLIVVGVARGGTSLIAGALHHLGVFSGDKAVPPVFEDIKLANAFENKEIALVKDIIEEYNSKDVWAFKRPAAINYLNELHDLVRNPIYLFIFKDIFSIANRNNISMKSDILSGIANAQNDYDKIIKFIRDFDANGFLFSYEKVMRNTEVFLNELVQIIGKEAVSETQYNFALKFIEPNPKDYLDATRITKTKGRIGSFNKTQIIGWAKYQHSDKEATVELYINEKLIGKKVAKDFRPNVLEAKQHPTGYCGYIFELDDRPLQNGDVIAVKVEDDVMYLDGSGQRYVELEKKK